MLPKDKKAIDDRMLTQYLLGALPEDDAERIDELSVADDAIALRLEEVENNLVDAHVRGELPSEDEATFRAHYLASPVRRAKVEFAEALAAATVKSGTPGGGARRAAAASEKRSTFLAWLSAPHFALQWGFALAAIAVAVAALYLLQQNRELVAKIGQVQTQQAALDARQKDLQEQIDRDNTAEAHAVPPAAVTEHAAASVIASVLLLPQTRGAGQPVSVLVEKDIASVPLELALESSEFARYQIALKDPAANRLVWTSGALPVKRGSNLNTVLAAIPAKILKQQNYSIELSGVPATGSPDLVGTYTFHAVLR
jgi:hypothetical protein